MYLPPCVSIGGGGGYFKVFFISLESFVTNGVFVMSPLMKLFKFEPLAWHSCIWSSENSRFCKIKSFIILINCLPKTWMLCLLHTCNGHVGFFDIIGMLHTICLIVLWISWTLYSYEIGLWYILKGVQWKINSRRKSYRLCVQTMPRNYIKAIGWDYRH